MPQNNIGSFTKDEIIEEIKTRAKSYVPEWRFDEKHPDAGTALALVYADMFSKTVKKFGRVIDKNRIAFLNELDAKLRPAMPAAGYVSFELVVSDAPSAELRAGTVVNAQSDDDEIGTIHFKTTDDLLVSPARVNTIMQTDDAEDQLFCLFDDGDDNTGAGGIELFSSQGENLQKHELYICHSSAFNIKNKAQILLSFYRLDSVRCSEETLSSLCDSSAAVIEYYTEDGYVGFAHAEVRDGAVCLHKASSQPPFELTEMNGVEGYFIRIRALDVAHFDKFSFTSIKLGGNMENVAPDAIFADGNESTEKYFPFGERLSLYSEVYFSSEEILCKKGAQVRLFFNVDYAKIPLDYNADSDTINWEWIMKRDSFRPDPEYDVTVAEVIWEYYNGIGWARLYPDARNSEAFSPGEVAVGQHRMIEFICPKDLVPTTVNSRASHFIRARITKINNAFKTKGAYIAPILTNTAWAYDYAGREVVSDKLLTLNSLDIQNATGGKSAERGVVLPFRRTGVPEKTLYFGFDYAPNDGPLKFLFELRDSNGKAQHELLWERYDGTRWIEQNIVDETRGFSVTGIITMLGGRFGSKSRMFGQERYWMRVRDMTQTRDASTASPLLLAIHSNTTKITNVDNTASVGFQMEVYQEDTRFVLPDKRIISAEVFVNELADLSEKELYELTQGGDAEVIYDETGVIIELWVRWSEVESFFGAESTARVFTVDKNDGVIMFGNGKNGRIPSAAKTENIRVDYRSGGGAHTNVPLGAVNQMERNIGFVSTVRNPISLAGGCDIEPINDAIVRSAAAIRHQNRAVTARDYEELAINASRSVARVKCFSGVDGSGERSPGSVTLVVLQGDYLKGGARFDNIKQAIDDYMRPRISGELIGEERFFIVEPQFVELTVRAELSVREPGQVFDVKNAAMQRLESFLDPINGGFNSRGWEIGSLPGMMQLKNVISAIPGLTRVRNVFVSAHLIGGGRRREVDLEGVSQSSFVLPVSGRHDVLIDVK